MANRSLTREEILSAVDTGKAAGDVSTIAKAERQQMSLVLNKRMMAWVQQYQQMMRSVYANWGQRRQSDSWTVWAKLAERFNMSPVEVANMPAPHVDGLIRAYTQNLEGPITVEPAEAESGKAPTSPATRGGIRPGDLAEKLSVSTDSVRNYARKAGIPIPKAGQRNFEYPPESVTAILQYAQCNAGDSRTRLCAAQLLRDVAR